MRFHPFSDHRLRSIKHNGGEIATHLEGFAGAVSGGSRGAPSRANGLSRQSAIRLDQIRTIDRQRIATRLGATDAATMKVDEAIKISLGLIEM